MDEFDAPEDPLGFFRGCLSVLIIHLVGAGLVVKVWLWLS